MKKSVIILTALVYLLSIVIVAFLGYQAEVQNPPILAESIVLRFEGDDKFPELPHEHIENGAIIYEVRYNPEYNPESEVLLNRYPYIYDIKDYDYLYYSVGGKLTLAAEPYSSKGEVSDKSLTYYVDKSKSDYIEVDQKGELTLKAETTSGFYEVLLSTNDGSAIKMTICIKW